MKIGVSTASLYPMHTEDALLTVARLGVRNVEIFLNSSVELSGEIFFHMQDTVKRYGLNIISVHPFSSPLETLFLFSSYDRRVAEIMDLYKRYFEFMNRLNAKIFVVHGAITSAKCSDGQYVERLSGLIEAGKAMGVTVAQENVSYCKSGSLPFLQMLSRELGDSAAFVLDVKQARRSQIPVSELLCALGSRIVHMHLSDCDGCDSKRDCLPIGEGSFDFEAFFAQAAKAGFRGSAVVELYRENYGDYSELSDCVNILEKMLEKG